MEVSNHTLPLLVLISTFAWASVSRAAVLNVGFEGIPDATVITNQIPGLTFMNDMVLSTSLNNAEYPPHSGVSAAYDNAGPISIAINPPTLGASAISGFSGYFTYTSQVVIQAYGSGNLLLNSTASHFSQNNSSSGNPPNEFLQLTGADIRSITITGSAIGGSFVMDDLAFTFNSASASVPEPGTWIYLLTALALLCSVRWIGKSAYR